MSGVLHYFRANPLSRRRANLIEITFNGNYFSNGYKIECTRNTNKAASTRIGIKKICGFKNVRIGVDMAKTYVGRHFEL